MPAVNRDTSSSVVAKLVIQRTVPAAESQVQKNDQSGNGVMLQGGARARRRCWPAAMA
jgi:hypothetical protein